MPERPIQSFIVQLLRAQIQTNARKRACQIISLTHFLTIRPSGMSTAPLSSTRGSAPAATAASSISDRSSFCRIGRTNMISLIPRQHSAAPAIIHDVTGKRCTSIAAASCFRIRDDIWGFVRDAGRRARRTDEGDRSPFSLASVVASTQEFSSQQTQNGFLWLRLADANTPAPHAEEPHRACSSSTATTRARPDCSIHIGRAPPLFDRRAHRHAPRTAPNRRSNIVQQLSA